MVTFLRRNAKKHSKFGKRRKKLLSWRKPHGVHNKMKERKRGYGPSVSIGYKKSEKTSEEKNIVRISNMKDLEKMNKNEIGFLEKMGKKSRIEILTKAKEKGIKIKNYNLTTFLKKETKLKEKSNESKK